QITHEMINVVLMAAWAADGQSIVTSYNEGAFSKWFSSELRLFDGSGVSRLLVPTPPNASEPSLSRDGHYVYYTERLTNFSMDANRINYVIKRRDLATGAAEEVAGGWGGAVSPQVSPDGRRLAFVRRVKDKTVLFSQDLVT